MEAGANVRADGTQDFSEGVDFSQCLLGSEDGDVSFLAGYPCV